MAKQYPMTSLILRAMPDDVKKYILKTQGEIKAKKGTQYSQESTIYQIVREHKTANSKETISS